MTLSLSYPKISTIISQGNYMDKLWITGLVVVDNLSKLPQKPSFNEGF